MSSAEDLRRILRRIDGRGYKAYKDKDIAGVYHFKEYTLFVDHVQGDGEQRRDIHRPARAGDTGTHLCLHNHRLC